MENFEPIGGATERAGLSGRFFGAGLTISHLTISRADEDSAALFRRLEETAEVRGLGLVDIEIEGREEVGGFVARNTGLIAESHVTGSVTGASHVGGFVGVNDGDISTSYARGSVWGTTHYVGGFVGHSRTGRIEYSYATASAWGSGFAGHANAAPIKHCYAIGSIGDLGRSRLIGDSLASSMIDNSYYFHPHDGSPIDTHGTALTMEEFGDAASFPAWDFEGIWQIQDFDSPGFARPTLRVNPES